MATIAPVPVETVHGGMIKRVVPQADRVVCQLSRGAPVIVSSILGCYLRAGDEIVAPLGGDETEIYVRKTASSRPLRDLHQAPIGYVT
jgi:hypothetical protein